MPFCALVVVAVHAHVFGSYVSGALPLQYCCEVYVMFGVVCEEHHVCCDVSSRRGCRAGDCGCAAASQPWLCSPSLPPLLPPVAGAHTE